MKDPDQKQPAMQDKTVYLKDYQAPDFFIETVDLTFELEEDKTRVRSQMSIKKNPQSTASSLELMGENLELGEIFINDQPLQCEDYAVSDTGLSIFKVPDAFELEIETFIKPQENFSLEGLYKSSGNYCTQCEAEGFRKITYFPDRPDVMALFSTTIIAEKAKYPVLLSNGNPEASGEYDDGYHWATWTDPFKKPCYLFALVAGDLSFVEDTFTTMNGREVLLRIYVQHHNIDKCEHAMESLKKSMRWDEEVYGREYDLDVYNIVAVDDFNMGAMENKGLNIFNSKYVLAKQETATDTDFMGIEGVIAHEYFHNWTGNRVTCRDWFQLTLKEGLTVFRDQQFTADMNSAAPKRIDDVNILRTAQFAEDAGPMAHPIQPDSYQEINNFYTVTVYNKGAEVIRMIHTLLGAEKFRAGMDLYFQRHDGQAVTTEEFVAAMEDASGIDLKQFRRWYHQAGTPEISVSEFYSDADKTYILELAQHTPPTPGQDEKLPFHIPVKIQLLGEPDSEPASPPQVLNLTEEKQRFEFHGLAKRPVLSILQGYSAPVKLKFDRSDEELAYCMAHEADDFNRWEAMQQLSSRLILSLVDDINAGRELALPDFYIDACRRNLNNRDLDKALIARALTLPSLSYIGEMMPVIDVDAIHQAREFIYSHLAEKLENDLLQAYRDNTQNDYDLSPESMAERFLKNQALAYLMYLPSGDALAREQYQGATNMTDQMAAFRGLLHHQSPAADAVCEAFYQQWHEDNLVMDKWFTVQATIPHRAVQQRVQQLFEHDDFDIKNPNRVRSLLGAFCSANPVNFHDESGFGYALLENWIEKLDAINPQIASRLCTPLTRWKRYNEKRQQLMKAALQRLLALPKLSRDVSELVDKSLK